MLIVDSSAASARLNGGPGTDSLEFQGENFLPNLRLLSFDGMHPSRVGQVALAEQIFRALRRRGLP